MGAKKKSGASPVPPAVIEKDSAGADLTTTELTEKQIDKQKNLAGSARTAEPASRGAIGVVLCFAVTMADGVEKVIRLTFGKWIKIGGERSMPYCLTRITSDAAANGGGFSSHADHLGSPIGVLGLYYKAKRRLAEKPLTKDGAIALGNKLAALLKPGAIKDLVDEAIEDGLLRYGKLRYDRKNADSRYDAFNKKARQDRPASLVAAFGTKDFDPAWLKANAPDWALEHDGDIDGFCDLLTDHYDFDFAVIGDGGADDDDDDDLY